MVGYSFENGMSNNAVAAYENGIKPLSKITILDLRAAGWEGTKKLAQALAKDGTWPRAEWHHSGGTYYNRVDFYDPTQLMDAWGEMTHKDREYKLQQISEKQAPSEGQKVTGKYAEFGGSRRRPRFLGHTEFTGLLVGAWIHLDDGGRKKATGNHIEWKYQ